MNNHICRAKSLDTGEWVYGYYVSTTDPLLDCAYHYILSQEYNSDTGLLDSFISWRRVDPNTVCRYTGMEDKNGTPIYENDCIGNMYNVIEYVYDGFYVAGDRPLSWFAAYDEVIGDEFDRKKVDNG